MIVYLLVSEVVVTVGEDKPPDSTSGQRKYRPCDISDMWYGFLAVTSARLQVFVNNCKPQDACVQLRAA